MPRIRISGLVILALALVASAAIPPRASGQYLKSRRTAPAPEFRDVTKWLNSEPLTMEGLRGKVVVVHFWTYGCYNCANNYPHYRAWQERYAGKDVAIVGIHTPETEGEHDIARIKAQAKKNGLKFAIAVDNDGSNWRAWNNRVWPTVYVVDRKGVVRYGWEGELNYKGQKGEETVRKTIDALLEEGDDKTSP